ncbi:hypothetical protein ACOZ35_15365 [Halorubrum xinjiangense]|uniref:hypothetical protein n=1 Tax=Halorubrum xinjiangense TaxID=261291 RepID=UPI003C6EE0CD
MKRRTVIAGFGGAAASVLAVGSGAFTTVSAERTVTIETADDDEALLALSDRGDSGDGFSGRSWSDGDTVSFSFPGTGRRISNPDLGLGVDSVYEFSRDSGDDAEAGLARIENRGTQPVAVYSKQNTDSGLEIELFDVDSTENTALRDDPAELTVGDFVDVGFRIRTHDAEIGDFSETLTIIADLPDT